MTSSSSPDFAVPLVLVINLDLLSLSSKNSPKALTKSD